jgi:hypothetical protein
VRETATIDDPKAAAVFSHGRGRKILLALVEKDRSLSELARLTETPLNLLHHHIGKFLELGLVVIARAERRAGAPIKFYRSTARSFFVPAELMAAHPGHGLNARLREALDRGLSGAIKGVSYSCENGRPRMRVVKGPEASTVTTELWLELKLSRTDAAALRDELRSLLQAYESRSSGGDRRYIVHAALAPG